MKTNWIQRILNAIADLIARTKGLDDIHDDLAGVVAGVEAIDDKVSGILVQVPFFAQVETVQNDVVTLFQFDALGCTIREIYISIHLPLHATATFIPVWEKTRAGDLVTFVAETVPAIAGVAPTAATVVSYKLGEIAQGLQGRLRLAQSDHVGLITVDVFAVVVMEL